MSNKYTARQELARKELVPKTFKEGLQIISFNTAMRNAVIPLLVATAPFVLSGGEILKGYEIDVESTAIQAQNTEPTMTTARAYTDFEIFSIGGSALLFAFAATSIGVTASERRKSNKLHDAVESGNIIKLPTREI